MPATVVLPVWLRIGDSDEGCQIGVIEMAVADATRTGPVIAEFLRAAADAYERTGQEDTADASAHG